MSNKKDKRKRKNAVTAPSRQRLWQIARMKEGNCTLCAKPAQGRYNCDACAKRNGVYKRRRPLKSDWALVDWSETNRVISSIMGVKCQSVSYQRKKRATSQKPAAAN